jgi:hypothetical protein
MLEQAADLHKILAFLVNRYDCREHNSYKIYKSSTLSSRIRAAAFTFYKQKIHGFARKTKSLTTEITEDTEREYH